ncbi:MFS transporter [Fusibacter ferrireducens]|uniref:MFS transporter n=1 Tax=Fusibacter ferrireducens TaxID=2785058 RepID=A0ABR9ZRX4_9FIRM|nr:MFS transporter [Fusibacter ferrireducens]MBF4693200.1 MFS transporter [Fusibacter ferrireducens]
MSENTLETSEKATSEKTTSEKTTSENILENRNFMLLLLGQIVSNLGNALYSISIIWYLMSKGTAQNVGLIVSGFGICMILPHVLVGPMGGVIVDRFNRLKIIYGTDFMRGVLFAILTVAIYADFYPIASIFVITIISNGLSSLFNSAVDASVPNIVHESQLNKANSYNGMSRQLMIIVGSAAAGFLYYYIGIVGILIINVISFMLSGLSEMFIVLEQKATGNIDFKEMKQDMKAGFNYIRKQPALLKTVIFFTLLNLIANPIYMVVFPRVIKFDLLLSARELGIFEAIFAGGSILGMIIASMLPVKKSYFKLISIALISQCFVFVLFAIPLMPWVLNQFKGIEILAAWAVVGITFAIINSLLNIPLFTILQTRIEDAYRGRVLSMITTLAQAAVPVGFIIMGLLADRVASWLLFLICGILSLIISSVFLVNKEIKAYW